MIGEIKYSEKELKRAGIKYKDYWTWGEDGRGYLIVKKK